MVRSIHAGQRTALVVLLASALMCSVLGKGSVQAAGPMPTLPGGMKMKLKVQPVPEDQLPPASNPYEGKPYAGCDGGYCPPQDAELERKFWRAAEKGDAKTVKQLLKNEALNISRNIVPDSEGMSRVIDVAMWTASYKGHENVMKVLLDTPGVKDMYEYEDGHILDLAAANGHLKMAKLLLERKMPVGPSAMAHAAHYNHTDVMQLLITKPMDLKATMQAISGGASPHMAKLIVGAMNMAEANREKRPNEHDYRAEYVQLSAASGNLEVLKLLLQEYSIPWQAAQGLIMAAAENGSPAVMDLLLSQKVFTDDKEELEEAVGNALKVAAEMNQEKIVDLLMAKHPRLVKESCKAAVFRAFKYGNSNIADILLEVCEVDKQSPKLQEADWLGKLAIAARAGDAATIKQLLENKDADRLLRKLQQQQKDPKTGSKGPLRPPHPSQDPLVMAAKGGHLEAVKLLANKHALCGACAAAVAARGKHTDVVKYLATGAGQAMMRNNGDTIDNALRVVAYSMEEGNWDLVKWMVNEHQSQELGPYFLTAIAQEGKIDDLKAMLAIIQEAGYDKTTYFKQMVHSARITAALGGQVEILLKLDEYTDPLTPEEEAADEERKGAHARVRPPQGADDDEDFLEDFKRKTEL